MAARLIRVVLVALVAFLIMVALRPGAFHIERSATISAPAEIVYAQIADYHKWEAWSPWAKLDPAMKTEFTGNGEAGSTYYWIGNKKVGEGRMTTTAATPASRLEMKLEFLKPFKATNTTTFALAPDGAGTKVTWSMDGTNGFVAKLFGLFMNMDKTVGGDFEKGLAQLKTVAESAPAPGTSAPMETTAPADTAAATQ